MTTTIDLAVTQPTLDELLKLTAAGGEVVLMKGGTVVARLTPEVGVSANVAAPRTPNLFPGAIWMSDDFNDPLPD